MPHLTCQEEPQSVFWHSRQLIVRSSLKFIATNAARHRVNGLAVLKEESEHLLVRADLLIQVQKTITSRGVTQAEAARVLRVTQPRVSDLLRGRIDLFSTDALIDMVARRGVGVRLVVKTPRSKKGT